MSLRIAYYYIKARGHIGPLLSIGAIIGILASNIGFLPFKIAPEIGVLISGSLVIAATIALIVPWVKLSRSEIDFVFSTPADPRSIFAGRFMAEWLVYLLLLTIYMMFFALSVTPPQRLADLPLYIASIVASATTLDVIVYMFLFSRYEKLARPALIAIGIFVIFLTFELVYQIPVSMAITSLIVTLVHLPLREYYANEFYTNAYGLLERSQPRPRPAKAPAVAPKPMPRELWKLALRTTYIFSGKKALAMALSIPAAGAAAYLSIAIRYPQWLADATGVSAFFLFSFLLPAHLTGPSLERLWIGFSTDHYAYVRWRTVARSLASLLATSPWIFAYALASLRYPPAAYAAASLASASLTFPILAWLIVALLGEPQIRRRGLPQRPAQYQLLLFLLLVVIVILYLHFWPYIAAFSAAFFYIALFTRLGRGLWDRLVYRLAEVGYV